MNITEMLLHRAAVVTASLPPHLRDNQHYAVFVVTNGTALHKNVVEAQMASVINDEQLKAANVQFVYVHPSSGATEIRGRTALHVFTSPDTQPLDGATTRSIRNTLLTAELALKCLHSSLYSDLQLASGVQQ